MATLLGLLGLCLLLLAPLYLVYKPPGLLIGYFAHRWPDVLWRVVLPPGAPKLVALTLDDAPSDHTREILSILRENDVHATFFVIGGQVRGREAILRDAVRPGTGHELANHGMHDEPARSLSDGELEAQLAEVQGMLQNAYAGQEPAREPTNYFRPGSGFFSDRMRALARRLGYHIVLGGVYPHDAQINYPWLNTRHILSMLRPGAIIICHDRRSWTPTMLRAMLPAAKRRGYQFVTVTELLRAAEPGRTSVSA